MLLVQAQNFYERGTGEKHEVTVLFADRRVYEVRIDDEFYATAESRGQAFDEVVDLIKAHNLTSIRWI